MLDIFRVLKDSLFARKYLLPLLMLSVWGWGAKLTAEPSPQIEPKALSILKEMSDRLTAARSLQFTAITSYESPSRLGPPLLYTTIAEVVLERPNRLRVITSADGPGSRFYYDGKKIKAYAFTENLLAEAAAPFTLDAALKQAYDVADIYFSFTDILVSNPYEGMAQGLQTAFVVGQSEVVGGITTDIIVLVNEQVFAQIWVGARDRLPRLIRAIYRDDPSRLRHQVEFSGWKLDEPLPEDTFTLAPREGVKLIPFARPQPPRP